MKTSDSLANDGFCPECHNELTKDVSGKGFVRHKDSKFVLNGRGGKPTLDEHGQPIPCTFGYGERDSRPNWTTDELILCLDLYFKFSPLTTNENHPEIIGLSDLLSKLRVHVGCLDSENLRSPGDVYMKLRCFGELDPTYTLSSTDGVSDRDREVWLEFAKAKPRLNSVAAAIRASANDTGPEVEAIRAYEDDGVEEAIEGTILTRLHRIRERKPELVRLKKAKVLQQHRALRCEVCDFEFWMQFGDIGKDFIECHHTSALSTLLPGQKTKLSDLALVCANCHRMLHRGKPWLRVGQLRAMIWKHPIATLEKFSEFVDRISAPHTGRLRRAAENQIHFMQTCHDRRMLERFEVTLSRYGIWAQELLEELQPLADDAPQGRATAKTLSEVAEAIRLFVDIQHRFCFQNYLAEQ